MELITANDRDYYIGGKVRGAMSNKYNRAAKLVARFDELDNKFRGIVERGIVSDTEHARCALALLLMLHTGIRVGNEGSAEGYETKPHPMQKDQTVRFVQTYGLTTLLPEHVRINRGMVELFFLGKKQVDNKFVIKDKFIADSLKQCLKNLEETDTQQQGYTVFGITDYMLTKFIKKYVGRAYSPKDFRCMRANMYAWEFVEANAEEEYTTKRDTKECIKQMYLSVSEWLNNTPGVCKKNYVSPKLEESIWERLV